MPSLRNEIAVAAPADDVWRILGDLRATPEWIPGVVEAEVTGDERLCLTVDGGEIRERITARSDEALSFSYEQTAVPLPISGSRGTLRVAENGAGSLVTWEAEFEAPDEVAAMVDGYYRETLEALKRRVETGPRAG
jgi:carbon monoxide dehydrogenase subunit G